MKKLMIAAAVVALAAVSQAASISWSIKTEAGQGATYNNYRVYICETLAADGFKSEAEISGYLLGTAGNTGTLVNNRGQAQSTGAVLGLDNAKSGQTQAFNVVIVAADGSGYWTTPGSAQIYTTETTHDDYSNLSINTLLAGTKTDWSTGPGPEPVPEPTSAMLLLLGVAGLALRRKQA